jgi:hypothetical protein
VRIPYIPVVRPGLLGLLGSKLFHYRPILAVRLTGPLGTVLLDGLLDTGSDDTVFHEDHAVPLGIDLTGADEHQVQLVGRSLPVRCRYADVRFRITDGLRETYEWNAVVAFASTRLRYSLLGQSGFLEFIDADFRGADREVVLIPSRSFPGTQVPMPLRP